jgi:hypothetical protein
MEATKPPHTKDRILFWRHTAMKHPSQGFGTRELELWIRGRKQGNLNFYMSEKMAH